MFVLLSSIGLIVQAVYSVTCTLTVPADPLSAVGLATPYILSGGCTMTNPDLQCFVEGAIYDPKTNTVSIYNPLVIDKGTTAAILPTAPVLPDGAVVALWFGSNNDDLVLDGDLKGGNCVNGLVVKNVLSQFGQFAYCNAPTFFANAVNVVIPPLGTASDGQPCPTTRDFFIVDQDQSDNVVTTYLLQNGKTAQNTVNNKKKLTNSTVLSNGSDNALLAFMDSIMGCTPFTGRDLAETAVVSFVPSLALNELQAAKFQAAPIAIVPDNDPMVLVNGANNVGKLNLYRVGVNQQPGLAASTLDYCKNMANIQAPRLLTNKVILEKAPSLALDTGDTQFTFLAARFVNAFGADNLNCIGLGLISPIAVTLDANGVAIDATITVNNNNDALIGGVTGGIGGALLLAGAFVTYRRRARTSSFGRSNEKGNGFIEMAAPTIAVNPGYGYHNNQGGNFATSFNNFRQSFNPGGFGQYIRQSMMNIGAFNSTPPMNNNNYYETRAGISPMTSKQPQNNMYRGNNVPAPQNKQFNAPSLYSNNIPTPYGGNAPNPYGSAPPQRSQYGAPNSSYGSSNPGASAGSAPNGSRYGGGAPPPVNNNFGGAPPPNNFGFQPTPYGGDVGGYGRGYQ